MRFEHVYLHQILLEIFFLHFGAGKTIVFKVVILFGTCLDTTYFFKKTYGMGVHCSNVPWRLIIAEPENESECLAITGFCWDVLCYFAKHSTTELPCALSYMPVTPSSHCNVDTRMMLTFAKWIRVHYLNTWSLHGFCSP